MRQAHAGGEGMAQNQQAAAAWEHLASLPKPTLAQLFADDAGRLDALATRIELGEYLLEDDGDGEDGDVVIEADGGEGEEPATITEGILFDWSKTHLDAAHIAGFEALAAAMNFDGRRAQLLGGEKINNTEGRAAEHTAQRGIGKETSVDEAEALQARMGTLVEAIHQGALGEVNHLIHIGIGGSALGPALAIDALARDFPLVDVHVVSNIDGCALEAAFAACDPATTLIAVASKTFTTIETMTNAASALEWLRASGVEDPYARVVALTAAPEKAVAWGVDETRILPFPESVGGRYSLWSSIGFPVAIGIGWDGFVDFLAGASVIDEHFAESDGADNLPLRAAFADQYYTRLLGCQSRACFAYDERLALLPDYLQQLEMESNGKSVTCE